MSGNKITKIADKMAKGGADKYIPPLQLSRESAQHLKAVRVPAAPQHQILLSDSPLYHSHANAANLRILQRHIQRSHQCLRYMRQRSEQTGRLAQLMSNRGESVSSSARRYGKRTRLANQMRPAAYAYNRACAKYDLAHKATIERQPSEKVAATIADGLIDADQSISTVKTALETENEGLPKQHGPGASSLPVKDSNNNNWEHRLAKERMPDAITEFGTPTWYIKSKGGEAVWLNPHFYTRVVVRDESIEHKFPEPHCDFFYASIGGIQLTRETMQQVEQLTDSVSYDQLKQELTARCHFMGANVATLSIALDLALGNITFEQAKESYPKKIKASTDPETYKTMRNKLAEQVTEAQAANTNPANFSCQ